MYYFPTSTRLSATENNANSTEHHQYACTVLRGRVIESPWLLNPSEKLESRFQDVLTFHSLEALWNTGSQGLHDTSLCLWYQWSNTSPRQFGSNGIMASKVYATVLKHKAQFSHPQCVEHEICCHYRVYQEEWDRDWRPSNHHSFLRGLLSTQQVPWWEINLFGIVVWINMAPIVP